MEFFLFGVGKFISSNESSLYITVYIAKYKQCEEQEYCRLLVKDLDGWACFTDLNIECRFIRLVLDGNDASIDQLLFL